MNTDKVNLVETFWSIKGEGPLTGKPMYFVRFAGCDNCLGFSSFIDDRTGKAARICTNFDGTSFACDTNFEAKESLTIEQLTERISRHYYSLARFNYVVITGGEPLVESNHPNLLALEQLLIQELRVPIVFHIETNGKHPIPEFRHSHHITCSPKAGYNIETLRQAHELRFMIFGKTKLESIDTLVNMATTREPRKDIRISPYATPEGIDQEALNNCLDILRLRPTWTLNVQIHKVINVL